METKTAIEEATRIAGSQAKLAAAIGCSKAQVNHWTPTASKAEVVPIPMHRCIAIERVTGISRQRLNPDIDWAMFSSKPARTRKAKPSEVSA